MRLTLRTLLAYLDGNLDADDAQEIGKKIEESEFATKLVHLIRDCTRRLRLGAPEVIGRGLGADPNTVAEYLEYRLADDRVPEFERICLDSEIQLAEVASCHQILTLVLGEPADIEPAMRERLYRIAERADQQPAAAVGATAAADAARPAAMPPPPVVRRPKPEVPEYLRERRFRFWPIAALVLIAAGLTFGGLVAFGPAPFRQSVTALMQAPAEETAADAAATEAAPPPGEAPGSDAPPTTPEPASGEPPGDQAPATDAPDTAEKNASPTPDAPGEPAPAEPGLPDAVPAEPAPGEPPPGDMPPGEPMPAEPTPVAPENPAARPAEPGAPKLEPGDPLPPLPDDPAAMPEKPPIEPSPPGDAPAAEPGAAAPAGDEPAQGFGRYAFTKQEVLLRYDPENNAWMRLAPNALLNKGDRLMSLPLFRPVIALAANVNVDAEGAAQFELVGWTPEGVPIIGLHYGRLTMSTIGKAGNEIQLVVDGQERKLTFVNPESTLAVEVRRTLPAGQDPEAGPAAVTAEVFATDGTIRVQEPGGAPLEMQAPGVRSLLDPAAQTTSAAFPEWLSRQPSAADTSLARDLSGYLAADKPATLQLRELTDAKHKLGRKREVRSLATRSLAQLGDYEPALDALNDPDLHNYWAAVIDELRACAARGPRDAGAMRGVFEKRRGAADGRALFRMLWGYTAADLKAGSNRDLVEALNRPDALDFRVLAIHNLAQITGATLGYHPEDTDIKRRGPYNAWKQRVDKIAPRAEGAPKARPAAKGS